VREQHFSLNSMAKIAGAGYLLSAASCTFSGWLSDRWIRSGATPTLVRKTFAGGGLATAGILLGLCVIAPPLTSIVLLISGMAFFGVSTSNVWAITQTLAGPQAAGRWTGFQNCVGNMAGVVAAAVTGLAVTRTGHFYLAFAIMSVVALAGTASWIFFVGPVKQVTWGKRLRAHSQTA
jgi:MFS transporter, ACS family, D-galactonate transporter